MPVPGIPILEGKYPSTMDLYPMEAKEFNRISQFYENLREKKLTTTKCKQCGQVFVIQPTTPREGEPSPAAGRSARLARR